MYREWNVWFVLVGILAATGSWRTANAAETPPNIVLILADDMGYGDVRALNEQSSIPTPHLDELAKQGVTFTDAHTPSSVCTPTRYGLLTGRYCWRTRLKKGVLNGYGEPLLARDRATLASFLRQEGYSTGIVGKWHLGLGFARDAQGRFDFTKPVSDSPKDHGFDFSHIIPASLDFPPYLFVRDGRISQFPGIQEPASGFPAFWRKGERAEEFVFEDCLDDLAEVACEFITEQSREKPPFFLYFPLTAPHKPVLPHRRFRNTTNRGPYGDFVHQVDATVGRVLRAIEDAGVADNTLVIYTSDNGSFMRRDDAVDAKDHVDDETLQVYRGDRHRANHVFRGTKADIWEAGHRVPFFVRWPNQIPASSKCHETICLVDVFATFAVLLGRGLKAEDAPDSFSFDALMRGESRTKPRAPVIHHSAGGMFAIRDGRWKLVAGNGSGGRARPRGEPFGRPYALYDLSVDPAETQNLIEKNRDIAKQLEAKLKQIRERGRSR